VLVAECAAAVTLVCLTLSLFGHEVGNHIRRGGKSGSDVAQLNMLATEGIRMSMWREAGLLAG
jgi:hypothetical protein